MQKLLIFLSLIALFLVGCAQEKPTGKTAAEVLYKEALSLIDSERYILATEKLNALRTQYPYSYYSVHAELLQADILFKQESYVEAAAAYQAFRDLHPKHKRLVYVIWMTAESYFNQLPPTFDRDLSPAYEAIRYYREITNNFRDTQYVTMAVKKINECRRQLRLKDKYVADFYFKTKVYSSARFRYLEILRKYSQKELVEHSKRRVVLASYRMNNYENCIRYAKEFSGSVSTDIKNEMLDLKKECISKFELELKKKR